jgi:pimeloyl-ACP methyl ester carboxylesterase
VDAERGMMARLPYAAVGSGPPLVVLAGLGPTTGVGGHGMLRVTLGPLAALARTRRLIVFNRRPHLPRGMAMADLAAEHADAIRDGLGAPVDVAGMSTGGSIAQQLAADHPDVVNRLVVISAACRVGPEGRSVQRRAAARIRAGAPRKALAVMAASLVPPRRGQTVMALAGWLLGPVLLRHDHDLDDMATTIEAEDEFDLAACAAPVAAPTLVLAGSDDRFYSRELFEETARLIPGSELRVFAGRGHITVMSDRGFHAALAEFLTTPAPRRTPGP